MSMIKQRLFLLVILCLLSLYVIDAKKAGKSKGKHKKYIKNCKSDDECPSGSDCLPPGNGKANGKAQKKCYRFTCADSPCANGATCHDGGPAGYTCTCAPGYTGFKCDIDIDECATEPCSNGSTCIDGINEYTCICVPGYTGFNCDTDIDDCQMDTCQNGGSCIDGVNEYTCTCALGFTGANCEINIDDCATDPCSNGATCNDEINGYTCTCTPEYTGFNCETEQPLFCQGPGCQNADQCTCTPGYSGSDCGIPDTPLDALSTEKTLLSPGHPCNYFQALNMRWQIVAPAGKRIQFEIKDFCTDEGFDYLYLHDGNCTGYPFQCQNIGKYSGNTIVDYIHDTRPRAFEYDSSLDQLFSVPMLTTSNILTISFESGYDAEGLGFRILYFYIN